MCVCVVCVYIYICIIIYIYKYIYTHTFTHALKTCTLYVSFIYNDFLFPEACKCRRKNLEALTRFYQPSRGIDTKFTIGTLNFALKVAKSWLEKKNKKIIIIIIFSYGANREQISSFLVLNSSYRTFFVPVSGATKSVLRPLGYSIETFLKSCIFYIVFSTIFCGRIYIRTRENAVELVFRTYQLCSFPLYTVNIYIQRKKKAPCSPILITVIILQNNS